MGTIVEIKVISSGSTDADQAIDSAFERIRQIERLMTAKKQGSWIEKISKEAVGRPLPIPRDINKVIALCLKYSRLTHGAFDISIGPISRFWRFNEEMLEIPDKQKVADALHLVDFTKIHLDMVNSTIELSQEGMSLDLGAAAKGYAVDEAVEVLKHKGIKAGLVNAGGDLKTFGKKTGGIPWNIGIQDPDHSSKIVGSISLTDRALVTSGDYERYVIDDKGVKYHHILDPKTGWPARGCKSVSIECDTALEADILSTGVFVLGPQEGISLIERLPGCEGMIIDSTGTILLSSGWRSAFKMAESP